ncbi:hypothetical protein BASA81_006852 [Batrachochytrium salamandrivorans]|nr:hypothetical protein BASA81_006852 [Batrachochytrium salamandrivorans]
MLAIGARLVAQTIKTFVLGVCAVSLLILATIGVPHALSGYCRLPAIDEHNVKFVSPQFLVRCCLLSVLMCALGVRWIGPNPKFNLVSFGGLLFAPFAVLGLGNALFNFVWFLFALQLGYSLYCIQTDLGKAYLQFLWVFRLCFAMALMGLVMFCIVVSLAFVDVDSMFIYAQRLLLENLLLLVIAAPCAGSLSFRKMQRPLPSLATIPTSWNANIRFTNHVFADTRCLVNGNVAPVAGSDP